MRTTQYARRAAQTLSSAETSRLVNEAARRASSSATPKRPRGLRRHADLIAVSVASIAAASALKQRRQFEEQVSFLEAELAHTQADRDRAMEIVTEVKVKVLEGVPEAVNIVDAVGQRRGTTEKVDILKGWFEETFDKILRDREEDEKAQLMGGEKPKMI